MWKAIIIVCALKSGECLNFDRFDEWYFSPIMCRIQVIAKWNQIVDRGVLSRVAGGYRVHIGCEQQSRFT